MNMAVLGGKHHIEFGNETRLVPGRDILAMGIKSAIGAKLGARHKLAADIVRPQLDRLQEAAHKVSALAGDKVRTPAGRHLAAESVAKAISKDLARTHDRVADLADRAVEESNEEILSVLGAFSGNEWVYQGAMPWFRELAANSDGRVKISDAIREDVRLAQVVWNAPHHMLGFGKDAAAVMRETVAKKWAGEAWERLNEGLSVQKTLPNYTKVIGDFHASAYNPAVIEMAQQSHVEV
jgi:hypothetical protein